MKRQNNRHLYDRQTFFAGFGEGEMPCFYEQGGNVYQAMQSLLASAILWLAVQRSDSTRPCRVLVNAPLDVLERSWFDEGTSAGWKLKSYSHVGRTAVYFNGLREVTLQRADMWLDVADTKQAARIFTDADDVFRRLFGFGLLASPTMTGLFAIEQTIPKSIDATKPSEEFLAYLHANTTQGRSEAFIPAEVKAFYYYDRRFAYAADCRAEMPCGVEQMECEGAFVPYEPAFYRVRFAVPERWCHVGLLPVLTVDGWRWPMSGTHETFVAEPELRIAFGCDWQIKVLEAWRFGKAKPLETWRNKLVNAWQVANQLKAKTEANIYRKILLHGIGGLYARSFQRERIIDGNELADLNTAEALTAEPLASGGFRTEMRAERGERFYMPHWSAYTWSRARAALLRSMLSLAPSSIIGCHVDAIYSSLPLYNGTGDGIGQFRLKGSASWNAPMQIRGQRDLLAMRAASEAAQGGIL